MAKYDVFISFKKTDKQGKLTKDYEMALELYNALEQRNIPAFFSENLRKRGESNFKKAIEAALADARLLIAVGSSRENMEAPWVEKEISTFEVSLLNSIKDPTQCTMVSYVTQDFPPAQLPGGLQLRESFMELEPLVEFVLKFLKNGSGFVDQAVAKNSLNIAVPSYMGVGYVIDGRYRVVREIGRGGFSQVFLAMDEKANRKVAVKTVDASQTKDASLVCKAFMDEVRIMQQLNDPHIPKIYEVIRQGDNIFTIVMELIEGRSLDQTLKEQGILTESAVLPIARQLAETLDYLHSRTAPIIYRDVKPANIILTNTAEVKLLDFGAARKYRPGRTADTVCLGTRGYAAPEQYGGMGQTDARTDIYGLGITLYQMVTGQNPLQEGFCVSPAREANPNLSYGLEYIIQKCTQRDPAMRFQSAAELLTALDQIDRISRREKRKSLIRRFFSFFRFRKNKPAAGALPPVLEPALPANTGMLLPPFESVGDTTVLSGSGGTLRLTQQRISDAEVPKWTEDQWKNATLQFCFAYFDLVGADISVFVRIDDINRGKEDKFGRPIASPQQQIEEQTLFTWDVKAGDCVSVTFGEDTPDSPEALHFVWIGKECRGNCGLPQSMVGDVPVTLWINREKAAVQNMRIISREERMRKSAREWLKGMVSESKHLVQTLSHTVQAQEGAVKAFASSYYRNILQTQMQLEDPAPVMSYLFVGPSGTSKAFLAQSIAKALNRPFAKIQMEGKVPQTQQQKDMIHFLRRSSGPVLLFEEIEKAELSTLRFLLQLLSGSCAGEGMSAFRLENTVIIVTTCVGQQLFDADVCANPSRVSRSQILKALSGADSGDGSCRFPEKLLEYTDWEQVMLFSPPTARDLCGVAKRELDHWAAQFRSKYGIAFRFSDEVYPLLLLSGEDMNSSERICGKAREFFFDQVLSLIQEPEMEEHLLSQKNVSVEVAAPKDENRAAQYEALCRDLQQGNPLSKSGAEGIQYLAHVHADPMGDVTKITLEVK